MAVLKDWRYWKRLKLSKLVTINIIAVSITYILYHLPTFNAFSFFLCSAKRSMGLPLLVNPPDESVPDVEGVMIEGGEKKDKFALSLLLELVLKERLKPPGVPVRVKLPLNIVEAN